MLTAPGRDVHRRGKVGLWTKADASSSFDDLVAGGPLRRRRHTAPTTATAPSPHRRPCLNRFLLYTHKRARISHLDQQVVHFECAHASLC